MFLFHATTCLSLLLLLLHVSSLLLSKLFSYLHQREEYIHREEKKELLHLEKEELIEDIVFGCEDLLFFFYENSVRNDTHDVGQDKNSGEQTTNFEFQADDDTINNNASESTAHNSSQENSTDEIPTKLIQSSEPAAVVKLIDSESKEEDFFKEKRFIIVDHSTHSDSKKFKLDEIHGESDYNYGDSSITGESSSWRSSTIFRDSETEYPFSSSSRRSSSLWESYTMFRKYDEEMLFFDKITAQKLHETETLESIKIKPRSVSQRIVHKYLKIKKHKQFPRSRDPYQELERAYVAQVCLAWEALSWNYSNFRRVSLDKNMDLYGYSARVAQEFQQFHVLLQRFIEIEPYEHGSRPQVFARMKISSPKLLQVPEFRDSEGDGSKENMSISSADFLNILEEGLKTFMNFLKTDKKSHCEMLKALLKKTSSKHSLIKKAKNKKKLKLKGLRKKKANEAQEMEILMGLIDMEVVSRVLRMPEISEEQLQWCEEKINKVRVWDGKTQRDSSPLFFPIAS